MSEAAALLSKLAELGIAVRGEAEQLKLKPAPPAEVLTQVRLHKADLLALLAPPAPAKTPAPEDYGCHNHTCRWCGAVWLCAMGHQNGGNPTKSCARCVRTPWGDLVRKYGVQ